MIHLIRPLPIRCWHFPMCWVARLMKNRLPTLPVKSDFLWNICVLQSWSPRCPKVHAKSLHVMRWNRLHLKNRFISRQARILQIKFWITKTMNQLKLPGQYSILLPRLQRPRMYVVAEFCLQSLSTELRYPLHDIHEQSVRTTILGFLLPHQAVRMVSKDECTDS